MQAKWIEWGYHLSIAWNLYGHTYICLEDYHISKKNTSVSYNLIQNCNRNFHFVFMRKRNPLPYIFLEYQHFFIFAFSIYFAFVCVFLENIAFSYNHRIDNVSFLIYNNKK